MRLVIVSTAFALLFPITAFATESYTEEWYKDNKRALLDLITDPPDEGIEFDSIDVIEMEDVDDLLNEFVQYHFGLDVFGDCDTFPLLAPDGEYRALLAVFSLDEQNEDTYDAVLEYYNEALRYDRMSYEARAEMNDRTLQQEYNEKACEYHRYCDTYIGLVLSLIHI